MPYTPFYTANLSVAVGPVAEGGNLAGMIDAGGGRGVITANTLTLTKVDGNGYDAFWGSMLIVPGSNAQLNSKQTVRLPANPGANFNVGIAARAKFWVGSTKRYQYLFGLFAMATGDGPRFATGCMEDGGGTSGLNEEHEAAWYDSTHAYDIELWVRGTNPTQMTLTATDVTTSTTHTISSTSSNAAMQTVGLNGLIHTYSNGQSAAGPTPYTAYAVQLDTAPPALTLTVTKTLQSATSVSFQGTTTGGVTPYVQEWYTDPSAQFVAGSGNKISNASGATLTYDNSSDARTTIAGALRFFREKVTDDAGTFVLSPALMTERTPLTPTFTIRPDLLAGRTLIYVRAGDSISTAGTPGYGIPNTGTAVYNAGSRLTSQYNITNVVKRFCACQGSHLLRDWQPDSAPYDAASQGGNGFPNGAADNLIDLLVDGTEAVASANPGALIHIGVQLGTNDLQNLTNEMTPQAMVAGWLAFVNYIHVTRNHPDWLVTIDGIPFGTAGTINTDAKKDAYKGWRDALLATTLPANTYHGSHRAWMGIYNDPSLLDSSLVHMSDSGQIQLGTWWADGSAARALAAVPVTPDTVATPVISPSGDTYNTAKNVSLSCATSGATIRYTVDGTTPTDSVGTIYTGPFLVATSKTIKAIAYKAGLVTSAVATAAYVIEIENGGGGNGSGVAILVQGPISITSADAGPDGTVRAFVGDAINIALAVKDGWNQPVTLAGATLSALLTDATGTAVEDAAGDVTTLFAAGGIAQVRILAPTTAGRYRLTLTRFTSEDDSVTFGPLVIQVAKR